ncbi:MAG: hypothetical protein Q4E53_08865 [Eubacteriales bacterium]|nr:hypothetical protein [Eubacteriales bacterium]
MNQSTKAKIGFMSAFSVGSVLFSAHAGGGFATGNQANTYYVSLGWAGILSAVLAMLLLTLTMRQAMVMYNSRGLNTYKELFETLFHPFDKLELLFELFFYIMVLMAVSAAISGAATALSQYFGLNYYIGIVIVGCIVLVLTIFGASVVRKATTYMGMIILVTAITIYIVGIFKSQTSISSVISADFASAGFSNIPKALLNAFTYAGFQCVTLPTMIACGTTMTNKEGCAKSMWISFVMNTVALVLSIVMLLSWQGYYTAVENGTSIPTLTSCNAMGMSWLTAIYGLCLLLCLISTGVTTSFGFVARFSKLSIFDGMKSEASKNALVSAFVIILSMFVSLVGLTNIIKYGYGYCGYLAIVIIVVPFLTVGVVKNRKYLAENNGEFKNHE